MLNKILTVLIFSATAISAQSSSLLCNWRYETGKINWDEFEDVIYTKEHAIIATGVSDYSYNSGKFYGKLLITCLNQNGAMTWTKSYGDSGSECFGRYIVESGTNFYVLGTKRTALEMYNKAWLLKLDSKGDTVWTKTYDPKYKSYIGSFTATDDNGLFMTVNVDTSYDGGYSQLWILRLGNNGDTIWSKLYNYKEMLSFDAAITTEDGGLLGGGVEAQWSPKSSGILLMKFDKNGDTVWTKKIPYEFNMYVNDIKSVGSNGYVIAGGVEDTGALIIRIDNNGKILWTRHFGERNAQALSVHVFQNGDFSVCNKMQVETESQDNYIMEIRLNQNGDSLNSSVYKTPDTMLITSGTFVDETNTIVCGSNFVSTYDCNAVIYNLKDTQVSVLRKREFNTPQLSSLPHMFDFSGRLISHQSITKLNMAKRLYIVKGKKGQSFVTSRFNSNYEKKQTK